MTENIEHTPINVDGCLKITYPEYVCDVCLKTIPGPSFMWIKKEPVVAGYGEYEKREYNICPSCFLKKLGVKP